MNPHIEKINADLYAVNMQYVRNGYIAEIKMVPGHENKAGQVNLSAEGRLLIDKSSKLYPALKKLFPIVMQMDGKKLSEIIQQNQNRELSPLGDLWVNVCGGELKRREQKALYERTHRKSLLQRIIEFFRKG